MLTENIKRECKRIDAWDKRYQKFIKPSIIIALATTIGFGYFAEQLPEDQIITDYPNLYIPISIITGIGFPVSLILYYLGKKSKISGYELSALRLYRTFTKLSDYKEDKLQSTRKKASKHIQKLLFDSPSYFTKESKIKPPFHFLAPHKEIYDKISVQLLPAIQKASPEQVLQIQITLALLIDCFFVENIDNIKSINDSLDEYQVQDEKSMSIEFLRKNKIAKIALIIIASIAIGGFVALLASLGGGNEQTTIIVWVSITGVSSGILFTKIKII